MKEISTHGVAPWNGIVKLGSDDINYKSRTKEKERESEDSIRILYGTRPTDFHERAARE